MLEGPEHCVVIGKEGLLKLMKNFDVLRDTVSLNKERFNLQLETSIFQDDGITDVVEIASIPFRESKSAILIQSTRLIHRELEQHTKLPSQWISLSWPLFAKLNTFLNKHAVFDGGHPDVISDDATKQSKEPSLPMLNKQQTLRSSKRLKKIPNLQLQNKRKKKPTKRALLSPSILSSNTRVSTPGSEEKSPLLERFREAISNPLFISNPKLFRRLIRKALAPTTTTMKESGKLSL